MFLDDLIRSLNLILSSNEVWSIAFLSILVSVTAVLISSSIGIPIGIYLGFNKKKEGLFFITVLNTSMGLPPVLVGLIVFLLVSHNGPLGSFGILFSPLAMIFAQAILTLPIVIGLTRSIIRSIPNELTETLISLGATSRQAKWEIFCEARSGIIITIIVALGRAMSEVGAIMIVGGNIRFHTRVLTTAIITEVSKGDNPMALALGILLLSISFSITSIFSFYQINSSD